MSATSTPTRLPAAEHGLDGERIGPVVAAVALVLTLAMLVWMASPPRAIAGDLVDAPFTLDARVVLGPDNDGCVTVVEGTTESEPLCADVEEAYAAWFTEDGGIAIGTHEDVVVLDAATGEVLRRSTEEAEYRERVPPRPGDDGLEDGEYLYTDGDRVLRGSERSSGPDDDEVVFDLDGPPGYRLQDASVSPDGRFVLMHGGGRLMVAEQGSDEAWLWVRTDGDWVDTTRAIDWG